MNQIMQMQTFETNYSIANKWSTLCNRKEKKHTMLLQKIKHIVQLQTNEHTMQQQTHEEQYAPATKWSTLCNCKRKKYILQLQTYEALYAIANK